MIILSIDPGSSTHGVVLYDATYRRVELAHSAASMDAALDMIREHRHRVSVVAIERIQAQGLAGASIIETSRAVGRMEQRALDSGVLAVELWYRHEVLRAIDVSGGHRDAQVRQRMIELHPGGVGTARARGPLYGTSGHAWQALGLAVAVARRSEREVR